MSNTENINPTSWNVSAQPAITSSADIKPLVEKIIKGDRNSLARAITLVESAQREHNLLRVELMEACAQYTGKSMRIGITGIPGAGKSTFIEALGMYLCNAGKKVAVLAIDPSSVKSGGSILGDKTRMTELSVHPNAFIRPSPGSDSPGGIAAHTREAMLVCEAAGFDVVLIETIGVGQTETWVRSITDLFLLLTVPNTGDELQGIKRGIMEMADLIVINKCDGDMITNAKKSRQQLMGAVHLFPSPESKFPVEIKEVSSIEKIGIESTWQSIGNYFNTIEINGWKAEQRKQQEKEWLHRLLHLEWARMVTEIINDDEWKTIENRISEGKSGVYREVNEIITRFHNKIRHSK